MDKDNNTGRSIVKKSASISFLVVLGKVLGFVKQSVIAWAFGANASTDVFFAADGYASMFGNVFTQTVGPTVLTQYISLYETGKTTESKKLIQNSYLFFSVVSILIIFINFILTEKIASIIGISYSNEQLKELHFFLLMLYPVVLFASLSGVSSGYLDAHSRFLPGRSLGMFFSTSIILFIFLFKDVLGIRSLLYGFLAGYFLHMVFMISLVLPKVGFGLMNPFRDTEFVNMIKRFIPLVIGISVVDIGHLVDKIIASSLAEGSVSALYYGQVISSDIVNAVIVGSIGAVLLPTITRAIVAKVDFSVLKIRIQRILKIMTYLLSGIASLYFVEGVDLIRLFFQRGSFDSSDTSVVSSIVVCYAISFIFIADRTVIVQTHYAFHDTRNPMVNSIIGVCCNILLSIVLARIMGSAGIALATSISMIIVFLLSTMTLRIHIHSYIIDRECLLDFIKSLLSCFVAVVIGRIIFKAMIYYNYLLRMVVVGLSICIIYFVCGLLFKEEAVKEALHYLERKLKS